MTDEPTYTQGGRWLTIDEAAVVTGRNPARLLPAFRTGELLSVRCQSGWRVDRRTLGVSRQRVQQMVAEGKLRFARAGRTVVLYYAEVYRVSGREAEDWRRFEEWAHANQTVDA